MLATYLARLGLTTAQSLRGPKLHPLDEVRLPLTIWPQDIDVYGHLNNGRYLTLMDLGRWTYSLRTGTLRTMLENKWIPVLGAAAIEFRAELRAFQRCQLVTRAVCWDEKWVYFEHRLERGDVLHARAIVRGVFKHGRRTVPFGQILETAGFTATSPMSTPALAQKIADAIVPRGNTATLPPV